MAVRHQDLLDLVRRELAQVVVLADEAGQRAGLTGGALSIAASSVG